MRYPYPKISNLLIYKRIDADTVCVVDYATDNRYTVSEDMMRRMCRLDGFTPPHEIFAALSKAEVKERIAWLRENNLLRESDLQTAPGGELLKTLWVPRRSRLMRLFARVFNTLLLVCWLPILATGVLLFSRNALQMEFGGMMLGLLPGVVLGALLHECGHAFAGMAYGARVFEMGVMLMYYVLPGAYVLIDDSPVKRKNCRIQINAAGMEANLLLVGVSLILAACVPPLGGIFLAAAAVNLVMAACNVLLIKGLDGTAILAILLGEAEPISRAFTVVFNRRVRRRTMKQGPCGAARVAACGVLCALQLTLPLLLLMNVLEVIVWLV